MVFLSRCTVTDDYLVYLRLYNKRLVGGPFEVFDLSTVVPQIFVVFISACPATSLRQQNAPDPLSSRGVLILVVDILI